MDKVLSTTRELHVRITERFPDSGLSKLAGELSSLAQESAARVRSIARPNLPLRIAVVLLTAGVIGIIVTFLASHRLAEQDWRTTTTKNFVELLEPSLGSIFFIGAAIYFIISLEGRLKRNRALDATHELRVLAHIIDMHQLTKDPEILLHQGPPTDHSPERTMSHFELSRYLDYCAEMLSLTSKVAALYAQNIKDPIALSAVDQIETLTSSLARKIWQKLMILNRFSVE